MKQIGYIHRYSRTEQKGILVYGFSSEPFWNSCAPVLFKSDQCITPIKSGILVYFNIDDDKIVSNIEHASIFNFDRKLLLSIISVFDSKDWEESKKYVQIRYQNISELEECVKQEKPASSDIINVEDSLKDNLLEENFCFDNYEFEDEEDDYVSDEYRKISIPVDIEGEYALFGRQFRTQSSIFCTDDRLNNKYIYIDILDSKLWIPKIPKSRKNYYGKDGNECIDLFNILVATRRKKYGDYLSRIRRGRDSFLWKQMHPELFLNDCVPLNWAYLLNRLQDKELEKVYSNCVLLQPVLPVSFCERYIDNLSEDYGFPSVTIAEKFLKNKIKKIITATDFIHYKKLLHNIKNCGVSHIIEEGVPFCAIDKEELDKISLLLSRKRKIVIEHIREQIFRANPHLRDDMDIDNIVDSNNNNLKLQIGSLYDQIELFVKSKTSLYTITKQLVSQYKKIPISVHSLYDSYLCEIIKQKMTEVINNAELSPSEFNLILNNLSEWISSTFLEDNKCLISKSFSNISDLSELWDAYKFGYLSEEVIVSIFINLLKTFTIYNLAQFITEANVNNGWVNFYETPLKVQKFALSRIVELYKTEGLPKGVSVRISEFNYFYNQETFIRWLTELKSGQYGNINIEIIESAISMIIENLDATEIRRLYDNKCLVKNNWEIKTLLNEHFHNIVENIEYQRYRDSLYDEDSPSSYLGSYAYDEMGYNDDDIETIFDGDPGAYWNID